MSWIPIALYVACFVLIAVCIASQIAIVQAINANDAAQHHFSVLTRDSLGFTREHRRLYPGSNARLIFWLSLFTAVFLGLCGVLSQAS